ncbi:MAG: hypothetical protein M0R67_08840 [Candidatus Cloacimonas sp.]|jgi:hypothetical protein|nr:hypothetical protein [Candidatus Cloacimonas sp.]
MKLNKEELIAFQERDLEEKINIDIQDQIEYDVFYDECKEDGYWHCFLFVPKDKKEYIHQLISKARGCTSFVYPIHYVNIKARTKFKVPNVQFVKILIDILLYIIQQDKIQAVIKWGENNKLYNEPKVGAKLAIFRKKYQNNSKSENQKMIEATFRMGLKGALNFLFIDEHPIIDNIYVDYSEKCFNNNFDSLNMWERLKNELRDNISYTSNSAIRFISKEDYTLDNAESQLMQFVDVIIGSIRTCVLQQTNFEARYKATEAIRTILLKDYNNYARMKNSRYYKGYTLSEATLENGEWEFKPIKIEFDKQQIEFFSSDDLN